MKETKFRGQRVDTKEWVEGGLLYSNADVFIVKKIGFRSDTNTVDVFQSCRVDPETVGQYTGLKDKNEKEIFKGDIVKYEFNNFNYRIEFLDGEFLLRRKFKNIENLYFTDVDYGLEIEVIGNIHEHGHLLEEKA